METPRHTQADRIRIARLSGTVERHTHLVATGAGTVAQAVAELHSISTDPHLLAHVAADPAREGYATRVEILTAAGADPLEMAALWSTRYGRATPADLGT